MLKNGKIIVYIANMLYIRIDIVVITLNLKVMKWNELRKIAEKYGWQIHRNGANHDIYRHPDRTKDDILIIARHGTEEIKNGTFSKIKKQIGF